MVHKLFTCTCLQSGLRRPHGRSERRAWVGRAGSFCRYGSKLGSGWQSSRRISSLSGAAGLFVESPTCQLPTGPNVWSSLCPSWRAAWLILKMAIHSVRVCFYMHVQLVVWLNKCSRTRISWQGASHQQMSTMNQLENNTHTCVKCVFCICSRCVFT